MFIFNGNQNEDGQVEQTATDSTQEMEALFSRCPIRGRGIGGDWGESVEQWANSRETLECNRVPCVCLGAMAIKLRQSSVTRPQSSKAKVSNRPIGGAGSVARRVMTSLTRANLIRFPSG